ncbi:hypothetical protein RB195_006886 [Necator americanus]|uniref:Uncharacterized protein n=1 Tax=Necator americanus TaxID=51031 RepID=A0ABR1BYB3_NECAM
MFKRPSIFLRSAAQLSEAGLARDSRLAAISLVERTDERTRTGLVHAEFVSVSVRYTQAGGGGGKQLWKQALTDAFMHTPRLRT